MFYDTDKIKINNMLKHALAYLNQAKLISQKSKVADNFAKLKDLKDIIKKIEELKNSKKEVELC